MSTHQTHAAVGRHRHLTPYCWSTICRVTIVPRVVPFAASPCILVRSTSRGWTHALMMTPDIEPALMLSDNLHPLTDLYRHSTRVKYM